MKQKQILLYPQSFKKVFSCYFLPKKIHKKSLCTSVLTMKSLKFYNKNVLKRISICTMNIKSYSDLVKGSNFYNKNNLASSLIQWALSSNISYISFSKLLKILKAYGIKELPENAKALIEAEENEMTIIDVTPGVYVHYGLEKNLIKLIFELNKRNLLKTNQIDISVFIDNLILPKLKNQGLWAILGSVDGFNKVVFLIGAYSGSSRPQNPNMFLQPFVTEVKHLYSKGLSLEGEKYTLNVKRIISDAPAKAFILNFKGSVGYSSCTKCNIVGEYKMNKICFPEKKNPRTNEDFLKDDIYKGEKTKLLEIPNFGVISNVPLDFMHVVCLGALKKLISIWLSKIDKYWESYTKTTEVFEKIVTPLEFNSKIKNFNTFSFWKPVQFRHFLLHYGPLILMGTLRKEYYDHFLLLHVACRILCMRNNNENMIEEAEHFLNKFMDKSKQLYGRETICHSYHGVYHLVEDYKLHGTFDNFSAFPFEKYLIQLRNSIQVFKKKKVPQTILWFSHEKVFAKSLLKLEGIHETLKHKVRQSNAVLQKDYKNFCDYQTLKMNYTDICTKNKGDKYVLLKNGLIVEATNLFYANKDKSQKFIGGKFFLTTSDLYKKPYNSSILKIFKVKNLCENIEVWPVDMIHKKCLIVPISKEENVIIGMLDGDI